MYSGVHILNPRTVPLAGMTEIGMRELRNQLAAALRRAGAGERLIVTVDGRPTAQLSPLDTDSFATSVSELVARGHIIAPRRRGDLVLPAPLALYSGVRIDKAVGEIRT